MDLKKVLVTNDFNKTLIFGWYGGGNFGDELLLSMLLNILNDRGYQDLKYLYLNEEIRTLLNQKYSYATSVKPNIELIKALLNTRNIIVGGGGHWGQDMNRNVFIMTLVLFFSRYLLNKKIFLLGVGFYNSTNRLGRLSAWLAAKAATYILARDNESFENFKKYNSKSTYLDKDIAFSLNELKIDENEYNAIKVLKTMKIESITKSILITVRHMQSNRGENYSKAIEELIRNNRDLHFILMSLEPRETYPQNYDQIKTIGSRYKNVTFTDARFNPLDFVMFLKKYSKEISLIAPQYHAQLIAHVVGMKHFPVVYDNKVRELLNTFEITEHVRMEDVNVNGLQEFVDTHH
jgi:polysaccharide pyruvyl transferase WcaK-like protein